MEVYGTICVMKVLQNKTLMWFVRRILVLNQRTLHSSILQTSPMDMRYGYEILSYQHACIGNEASLCDCHKTSQNCLSTNAVAIKCQRPGIDLILYHIVLAML